MRKLARPRMKNKAELPSLRSNISPTKANTSAGNTNLRDLPEEGRNSKAQISKGIKTGLKMAWPPLLPVPTAMISASATNQNSKKMFLERKDCMANAYLTMYGMLPEKIFASESFTTVVSRNGSRNGIAN